MTEKFERNSWVKRQADGRRGFVKDCCGRDAFVRWVGQDRVQKCDVRVLKKCDPPRALVLEGSLERQLHSIRSEEDALRTWLTAKGVLLAYQNILTLEDIDVIGKAIGRNRPPFVHISCHGNYECDDTKEELHPCIYLAPQATPIYLGVVHQLT